MRRKLLVQRFVMALTSGQSSVRPIEMQAHDPVRYVHMLLLVFLYVRYLHSISQKHKALNTILDWGRVGSPLPLATYVRTILL